MCDHGADDDLMDIDMDIQCKEEADDSVHAEFSSTDSSDDPSLAQFIDNSDEWSYDDDEWYPTVEVGVKRKSPPSLDTTQEIMCNKRRKLNPVIVK